MIKIYENNKFIIYEYDTYEGLYYVWPKDDKLDTYYTDKKHVQKLIKEGEEKMIKLVYEDALDIVIEALEQPDKSVIFKHTGLNKLKKTLQQAQKQEKLLELYKDLSNYVDEQTYAHYLPEIILLKIKIEELENDN